MKDNWETLLTSEFVVSGSTFPLKISQGFVPEEVRNHSALGCVIHLWHSSLKGTIYKNSVSVTLLLWALGILQRAKSPKFAIPLPSQTMGLWPHQQFVTAETLAGAHLQIGLGRVGSCHFVFYSNICVIFTQLPLWLAFIWPSGSTFGTSICWGFFTISENNVDSSSKHLSFVFCFIFYSIWVPIQ